jgi:AcrR family transcriptional regulator
MDQREKGTARSGAGQRRRNPERTELRRQQVLDAAAECFRRSGFRGTSMAEISALAEMSTGHIYHYFKNKEAIVAAIVERDKERVLANIAALTEQPNVLQALLDAAGDPNSCTEPQGAALLLEIFAEASRNPLVADITRERDTILRAAMEGALRIGQKQGSITDETDLDSLIILLGAFFHGLTIRRALYGDTECQGVSRLFRLLLERLLAPA